MSLENGLRYDDIYRLCENKLNLHSWLRAKGLIGDFQGQSCDKCSVGTYQLVADRTYPKTDLFGVAKGKIVSIKLRFGKEAGLLDHTWS